MKKSVRVVSLFAALIFAAGAMAGCGGKKDEGLSVSNWPNPEANPKGYETYEKRKAQFESDNPDCKIIPDEWAYDVRTYLAKAEGGTLPDLYYTPFTELNKIMDGEYAVDIKNKLKELDYYDKISDSMLKLIERDGEVYFIPKSCYTLGLAMNLDMFENAGLMEADGTPKVPTTMDELVKTAQTITEKTGKPGFIFPTTNNQGGWYFTMLGWNYGVEFVKREDDRWVAAFDTDDCVAALQYIKDLKWKYHVLPSNELVDSNEMNKQLGSGMVGMAIMSPTAINNTIRNYGTNKDIIGYSYIPAGPKAHVTLMGGSVAVFANTATKNDINVGFKWLEVENITPNLTDDFKTKYEEKQKVKLDDGELVGIIDMPIWNEKSEVYTYTSKLDIDNCNVNYNHIKLFNENKLEVHTEVEVCAQELYGLLDACIQEVLTNKDADCKALIKGAAEDYQTNFLDYEG